MSQLETAAQATTPTDAVVMAIADVRDTEPVDLEVPLYRVVDSDAIDRLLRTSGDEQLSVTFQYLDHIVAVYQDLTVIVDGTTFEPPVDTEAYE
jgi:hypothetical protein